MKTFKIETAPATAGANTNQPATAMREAVGGFVHSYEPSGAVDGPGLRFVVFMSGCLMRCLYCHNPDTWERGSGTWRSVEAVVTEIGHYATFLQATGGLTVSGGEPLVQAEFVHELMRQCKEKFGLHTALDTNGFLTHNLPDEWFDVVDLVLLDIKHIDEEKHLHLTAVSNQPILEFAERLARMGKPAWIRYVLVPGLTDDEADVERLAVFVAGLKNVERVEILPFHKMGEYKWKELGLEYQLSATGPPDAAIVERVRRQFEAHGLVVVA